MTDHMVAICATMLGMACLSLIAYHVDVYLETRRKK